MNCLCCGKPLNGSAKAGWHAHCLQTFFGTNEMPEVQIDEQTLELLAAESTYKGYTVPGVQKKLSLHLFSQNNNPRLTLVNYPTGYILKPQVAEFETLPEAEQAVMCMADVVGIATVPHGLIRSSDGSFAYITKRIDRVLAGDTVKMLAMEDFCQLDLRLTQDKYKGSYERCGKIIARYSARKESDMEGLFLRLVFSFLVGNSDMHLKNFSLIETEEGSGSYLLSPAYDLLPVNVIMPEDKEQFALPMNGKKMNLRRKDFLVFADGCGIARIAAQRIIEHVTAYKNTFISMCNESFLPDRLKERFVALIEERVNVF